MDSVAERMVVLAGNGCPELSLRTAKRLQVPLGQVRIDHFADGEVSVWIAEDVKGKDVVVVQSMGPPVNEHFMELLLLCDAARQSGAESITAVIPYFGYGRQDHQSRPGEPISAAVIVRCIEASGITRVISLDVHSENLKRHFTKPFIHLSAVDVLAKKLAAQDPADPFIIAPDVGAAVRALQFASILHCPVIIGRKRRDLADKDSITSLVLDGDIVGKTAIVVDDMISTGGTVQWAVTLLGNQGIHHIWVCATHFLGLSQAVKVLGNSPITASLVTDSLPIKERPTSMTIVSVDALIARAVTEVA